MIEQRFRIWMTRDRTAPPGHESFCATVQVPRSQARLHLANFHGPAGAPNRPDRAMDVSRWQARSCARPPVPAAKGPAPRTGRWNRALTICRVMLRECFREPLQGTNRFARRSRCRARRLACTWLISMAPLGHRIAPTGRWALAGGNRRSGCRARRLACTWLISMAPRGWGLHNGFRVCVVGNSLRQRRDIADPFEAEGSEALKLFGVTSLA